MSEVWASLLILLGGVTGILIMGLMNDNVLVVSLMVLAAVALVVYIARR